MEQWRDVCFTLNNPTLSLEDFTNRIEGMLPVQYLVIGEEVGESGTRHYQGFLQLLRRTRHRKVHEILMHAHMEVRRGTPQQASEYCQKDGLFTIRGLLKNEVSKSDSNKEQWSKILQLAQEGQLDELQRDYPGEYIRYRTQLAKVHVEAMEALSTDKTCVWLYGPPGTGKSRFARDVDVNAYWKNPNKWFDNYNQNLHKTVIIDDFDTTHKVLGYHIKRWADRYPVLCETKGGAIYTSYDRLVITSNYSIEEIWTDDITLQAAIKRRFKVYKVLDHVESLEGILSIKTTTPEDLYDYKFINKFEMFNLNN